MAYFTDVEITDFQITNWGSQYIAIQWDLYIADGSLWNASDFRFNIYKSEGYGSPEFISLVSDLSTNYYNDSDVDRRHKSIIYYYKIGITNITAPGYEDITDPKPFETIIDPLAKEIRRQEELIFRQYIVNDVYILNKMKSGSLCPSCTRDGVIVKPNCKLCNGTGRVIGFWSKVSSYAHITPPQVTEGEAQFGYDGIRELMRINLIDAPIVQKGDIIYFINRDRAYEVVARQFTLFKGAILHQTADIVEIGEQHPVYEHLYQN